MKILSQTVKDLVVTTEYTRDGITPSHIIIHDIQPENEPIEKDYTPSIQERILAETQYQTALLETNIMGGI